MISWQPSDTVAVLSLSAVTISFIAYHFFVHSNLVTTQTPVKRIVVQRLSGLVLMGIIPLIIALLVTKEGLSYFGWGTQNMGQSVRWVLMAAVLIIPLGFFNARNPNNLRMYPQIRVPAWSYSLIWWSGLTWVLYLVGYETLFRGILFFPLLDHFGLIPAMAVNVAIYSIAHIPKGIGEAIGAIPFGIVVCLAAFATGTIWFPLLVHCVLALSNEWFSLYFNPEMHVKKTF